MNEKLNYIELRIEEVYKDISKKEFEIYFDDSTDYFYVKILDYNLYNDEIFLTRAMDLIDEFYQKYFGYFLAFIYPQSISVERGELISVVIEPSSINYFKNQTKYNAFSYTDDADEFIFEPFITELLDTKENNSSTLIMAA